MLNSGLRLTEAGMLCLWALTQSDKDKSEPGKQNFAAACRHAEQAI